MNWKILPRSLIFHFRGSFLSSSGPTRWPYLITKKRIITDQFGYIPPAKAKFSIISVNYRYGPSTPSLHPIIIILYPYWFQALIEPKPWLDIQRPYRRTCASANLPTKPLPDTQALWKSKFYTMLFWFAFNAKNYVFLSPQGKSEANPMGSTWQSFHFICDRETQIELSKTLARIGLFWNLENLYPSKGSA